MVSLFVSLRLPLQSVVVILTADVRHYAISSLQCSVLFAAAQRLFMTSAQTDETLPDPLCDVDVAQTVCIL